MPFFIEDLTDRSVRVPDDERRIHANGVTGVARIVIAVEDLEPVPIRRCFMRMGELLGVFATVTVNHAWIIVFRLPGISCVRQTESKVK
jgi:hypothetical protein